MTGLTSEQKAHLYADRLAAERRLVRGRLNHLRDIQHAAALELDLLIEAFDSAEGVRA